MTYWAYLMEMTLLFGLVAVLGAVVAGYAFLAYRRERERPMLFLSVGLLLLSVGPAAAWLGIYGAFEDVYGASIGCAGFLAAGFACVLASVRARVA